MGNITKNKHGFRDGNLRDEEFSRPTARITMSPVIADVSISPRAHSQREREREREREFSEVTIWADAEARIGPLNLIFLFQSECLR